MEEKIHIQLIVGLGNPGREYENTRHNLGFRTVDLLAEEWDASWKSWSGVALTAKPDRPSPVVLAKPVTYMNNSGQAVRRLCDYYRISSQEILVVVDDFALPLGCLRLRERGSAGGHNGLASIIEHLGTSDFPRLRLGIGPVPADMDCADFVLAPVRGEEKETVQRMVEEAARTVENVLTAGLARAVSQIKNVAPEKE